LKPTIEQLEKIKDLWKIHEDLEEVRKVENWIYKAPKSKVFVRLTAPSHRTIDQIESELDWMSYLSSQGVKLGRPIVSKNGNFVEKVKDKDEFHFVAVLQAVEGLSLHKAEDFTAERMKNWGSIIGEMHTATIKYNPGPRLARRHEWNEYRDYNASVQLYSGGSGIMDSRFKEIQNFFSILPENKNNFGLIHADVHQGNFFVAVDDSITLIDFDDGHYFWFAYDLAVPLFTLDRTFYVKGGSDQKMTELFKHFYEGYCETYVDSNFVVGDVPKFVEYRCLCIYSWCLNNLENPTLSKTAKEWMKNTCSYTMAAVEGGDFSRFSIRP
jgi:amicoumacin kinase